MVITNLNNSLNSYLYTNLGQDLQQLQNNAAIEVSKAKAEEIPMAVPSQAHREIKDEYIPRNSEKVKVTLEERLSQVISPEEIKNLLSLLMRMPRISNIPGDLLDVKG